MPPITNRSNNNTSSQEDSPWPAKFLAYLPDEDSARKLADLVSSRPDTTAEVSEREHTPGLDYDWFVGISRPMAGEDAINEAIEAYGFLIEDCLGGRSLGCEFRPPPGLKPTDVYRIMGHVLVEGGYVDGWTDMPEVRHPQAFKRQADSLRRYMEDELGVPFRDGDIPVLQHDPVAEPERFISLN